MDQTPLRDGAGFTVAAIGESFSLGPLPHAETNLRKTQDSVDSTDQSWIE